MKGILFLCVANSARSQMAEGWARHLAGDALPVESAGSVPTELNPLAVRAMAEVGVDLSGHRSKPIPAESLDRFAVVVTLCAEEACPVVPGGVERRQWPLPDPAAASGGDEERLAAFRRVRDELKPRVEQLLAELVPTG